MKRYYEIELSNDNTVDRSLGGHESDYSICIIAEHYPNIEETEKFLKEHNSMEGRDYVVGVTPLTEDEAFEYFNFDHVENVLVLK